MRRNQTRFILYIKQSGFDVSAGGSGRGDSATGLETEEIYLHGGWEQVNCAPVRVPRSPWIKKQKFDAHMDELPLNCLSVCVCV